MGILSPVFRNISQFPKSLDALAPVLSRFEGNIADAFTGLLKCRQPQLTVTERKTSIVQGRVDEVVSVDTSGANVPVLLPVATPDNKGHLVGVLKTASANSAIVECVGQLVQGAASDTLSTAGLYLYLSTGAAWWRQP